MKIVICDEPLTFLNHVLIFHKSKKGFRGFTLFINKEGVPITYDNKVCALKCK